MSNAYEMPNLRFTGIAKTEIHLHRLVAVDTNENFKLAGQDDTVIGASLDHVDAGRPLTVADGIMVVEAAEAIQAGKAIMADQGKAKLLVTGKKEAGTTLTAATAAGQFVTVKLR